MADRAIVQNDSGSKGVDDGGLSDPKRVRRAIDEAERKRLLGVLEETQWIVGGPDGAAARLGLNRSTLQYKMRKLGIPNRRDRV